MRGRRYVLFYFPLSSPCAPSSIVVLYSPCYKDVNSRPFRVRKAHVKRLSFLGRNRFSQARCGLGCYTSHAHFNANPVDYRSDQWNCFWCGHVLDCDIHNLAKASSSQKTSYWQDSNLSILYAAPNLVVSYRRCGGSARGSHYGAFRTSSGEQAKPTPLFTIHSW